MRGLLIKDIINMKAQTKVLILLIVFQFFVAISIENTSMLGGIIAIMAAMLPITAMAYDEKAKWDRYALTMPITRRDLVLSKYILGIGFSVIAFIFNILLNVILGYYPTKEIFILSAAFLGAGLLFLTLVMPVMFKYGVEKGRIVMMIMIFSPTAVAVLLQKVNLAPPSQAFLDQLVYVIPAVLVVLLGLSILLSVRIYQKKEL